MNIFLKKYLKYIIIVIVAVLVGAGGMFLIQESKKDETEKIIDKVSNIMILPNETPIISTIEDADGLREESPFYSGVKKGDKILIYKESAKVIIYREKDNKIINCGPIINDQREMTND